ncbi:hypothetical protein DV515_00007367 [Chloebia gouldiae]|uniref:Uncharacterized protein n=1 Tax=Chloebia gouldiae TaxID=44316 RepID=A0A3L8SI92_CHLGU|nr:hypothetical protein DV515_00007367 [Chloebia gouldiae]
MCVPQAPSHGRRERPGNSRAHSQLLKPCTSCITRKELTCQGNWLRGFLHKIAATGVQ